MATYVFIYGAGATGFEPATFGFGDQCYHLLSYTPVIFVLPTGLEPVFPVRKTGDSTCLSSGAENHDKENWQALLKNAEAIFGRN